MRRARVEGIDGAHRDASGSEQLEGVRARVADRVHEEIARVDAGHPGEGREPAQGIQMEPGMVVDHTGEVSSWPGVIRPR